MNLTFDSVQKFLLETFGHDRNILGVMIFGSFARGTADVSSDVDVFVLSRRPMSLERKNFVWNGVPFDVLFDDVKRLERFLAADRRSVRRPTSHMLAEGKIIFERSPDFRRLQKWAQRNLSTKTKLTKDDSLMHAYSLHDFLDDLRRDAKRGDDTAFGLDAQLLVNNAVDLVLASHRTYWRRSDETVALLKRLDAEFHRRLCAVFRAGSLPLKLHHCTRLVAWLETRYRAVLTGAWKIRRLR